MPLRRPIPETLPPSTAAEPQQETRAACLMALNAWASKSGSTLSYQITEADTVSVYGLGRLPVTLPYEQWRQVLAQAEELRSLFESHLSHASLPRTGARGHQEIG